MSVLRNTTEAVSNVGKSSRGYRSRYATLCLAATFVWCATISQCGQVAYAASTLIPVPTRADHVYDPLRDLLYISSSDGTLQRWDVASKTLLAPFNVGIRLTGIDITADNSFVYAGEGEAGATSGFVRKVDLNTGTKVNLTYDLAGSERGVVDLNIASNGVALFTSSYAGSGSTPIHSITLATDTLGVAGGTTQNTGIARGPDRSLLFFQHGNISSGPISVYSAATSSFTAGKDTNHFVGGAPAAVNRNGTLIAFENSLMNPALNTVELIPGSSGGFQFDPFRDILYVADRNLDAIRAYDSSTLAVLGTMPVGENIGDGSTMSISADTKFLFVTTPTGVRMIDNTLAVPEPGTAVLLALGAIGLAVPMRRAIRRRSSSSGNRR